MGSIPEMLQSVQAGSLSMSMAVPAWYSSFIKPLDAFTLPYLVGNEDKLRPALEGPLGAQINKFAEPAGFKVLGYLLLGSRSIVNKQRAVNKPEDCKGLKLRVINSPVYLATFRALGANPVAMDPSELYLALQQGVVDGFEYPVLDLVTQRMYEVSKFLSLDRHTTDFFIITTSVKTWNGFSAQEQGWITQAMKTATDWQWKEQPQQIAQALVKLKTLMTVNEISPENKKLFVEATKPVYAQFEPSIGKDFLNLAIKELN
jgi:C4-dicarboxylate-binding protein DctP